MGVTNEGPPDDSMAISEQSAGQDVEAKDEPPAFDGDKAATDPPPIETAIIETITAELEAATVQPDTVKPNEIQVFSAQDAGDTEETDKTPEPETVEAQEAEGVAFGTSTPSGSYTGAVAVTPVPTRRLTSTPIPTSTPRLTSTPISKPTSKPTVARATFSPTPLRPIPSATISPARSRLSDEQVGKVSLLEPVDGASLTDTLKWKFRWSPLPGGSPAGTLYELVFWAPDNQNDKRSPVGAKADTTVSIDLSAADRSLGKIVETKSDTCWGVRLWMSTKMHRGHC